ncbi:MAG: STAS domain-containing protein [Candidatus Kapaibacterium sp.]
MIIDNKEFSVFEIVEDSIGLAKSHELKQSVDKELKSGGKHIALDFGKLNSINSAGLGVLIGILNNIKSSEGSLKLLNVNERIMNIFKITKLDTIFDINK